MLINIKELEKDYNRTIFNFLLTFRFYLWFIMLCRVSRKSVEESEYSRNQWYIQLIIYCCTKLWNSQLDKKLVSGRSGKREGDCWWWVMRCQGKYERGCVRTSRSVWMDQGLVKFDPTHWTAVFPSICLCLHWSRKGGGTYLLAFAGYTCCLSHHTFREIQVGLPYSLKTSCWCKVHAP